MHAESIRAKVRRARPGVLLVSSVPLGDSAAFIHGLRRLPGTGTLFRVREPAGRKKGVTRSRVVERDDRRDGRRCEKRNERTVERIGRTGYGRGRKGRRSNIVICSRGTREINGSRNRQKPVRGQKTRCRHRLNCRRAIRGERRREKKEKKKGVVSRRERVRIEKRLSQKEEKGPGDSDGRGR